MANNLIAIDCEMAKDAFGNKILTRCSIVNKDGKVIFDKYVKPRMHEEITDYETDLTGITEQIIRDKGGDFNDIRRIVINIMKGSIVVGHSVYYDLNSLLIIPEEYNVTVMDTSVIFMNANNWTKKPSLRTLVKKFFNVEIQSGNHSSIEDAKYAMKLFLIENKIAKK